MAASMQSEGHKHTPFEYMAFISPKPKIPEANYCVALMQCLNDFRKHNVLCEVTIVVNGKPFYAHRNVLAAASPYFRSMFSSHFREQNESKPVILENITADVMEELLNFIYTGTIKITPFNVKDLVSASNYLLMNSLKDACVSFMKSMINPSNCLGIETAANQFDCEALRKTANQYILDNFATVSQTDEFKSLPADKLEEFLSSDETKVDREEQIFEALETWVSHNEDERKPLFPRLIQHVRFPLMSPYYLADFVETKELVLKTPECTPLLLEAKNYHMLPDRRHLIKGSRTKPRKSMGFVTVIFSAGGIQGSSVMKNTFCYVPKSNKWYPLAHMLVARCRHGLALTGDMVYSVGGQSREGAAQSSLSSVERYDPRTNTWTMVAPMNVRRSLLNVAVLDGRLYAVGGCDENNFRLNSVEHYNPFTDTWHYSAPMATCRSSPCVLATGRALYVVGGVNYVGMSLNTGECFDPLANTWSPIAPMIEKRASACGAVCNGKAYVIGGWDGQKHLNTGEMYEPEIDQWTVIPQASTARWDAGIAVESDRIFVVGGCDRNALCTLETECYDPEKKKWSKVASLPVATHGLKCSTIQLPNKLI
ncbi:kelch-like protein diablo [Nematostella vectensis]|uniref:kelch-like protein diablo n=1 Tax=Nematostella vectensis TaxID=45351 RepID=UPI0020773A37|nr:kelch-like protein diablo [Nematostella vectensis]